MIEGSFLPSRFRGEQIDSHAAAPSWLNKKITSLLQVFTRITASRPIHIVVIVTLLTSSSYISLLEDSLVNATSSVRKTEWSSLAEGSRRLRTGPDTAWTWQNDEVESLPATNVDNIALLTLVFSQTMSTDTCRARPSVKPYATFANISATPLPPTSNSSAKTSQEGALAFAVPYSQVPDFLAAAQKIPSDISSQATWGNGRDREETIWVIENSRVQTGRSFVGWVQNAWIELLTLIKNTDALDIAIMVLGYTSMHLTFISLSFSMRRIGSNFWLTTSVLLSSCFAFLFGLFVMTKLGRSPTVVLLSEGLPFLVVIIGFEKNVVLARAVLSHAAEHRRSSGLDIGKSSKKSKVSSSYIQSAIQAAMEEQGFDIIKHYAIEIGIVVVGAIFGVEGGLQQFCFLAAWILFFDCILLFSFYTAILCIKLEINRIKRHVDVRKALEDDGLSHQVAEKVAQSNDWPGIDGKNQPGATIFGRQLTSTQISKFKIAMVSGFILINAFNISSWARGFGGGVAPSLIDPFDIASNGLDVVLSMAKENHAETIVTVIAPIRYELEMPSVQYHLPQNSAREDEDTFGNLKGYGVGGRMVGSVLKSFEDPVLSKLIVVALILSVALNGYLFNAPTTGITDPNDQKRPIDPEELAQAQIFNDAESVTLPLIAYMGSQPSIVPLTPASTDDEGDTTVRDSQRKPPLPDMPVAIRGKEETEKMLLEKRGHELVDEEVIELSMRGKIPGYALEKTLKDFTRAVKIRRAIVSRTKVTAKLTGVLQHSKLPYQNYNWAQVFGACCENVVGYMPVPVGVTGPLVIDGTSYFIPMATTEGVLVASTSRGCKAINSGGGAITVLTADGMTRGPCVSFERLERAGAAKIWLDSESGQKTMKKAFNSTSRFARLETMKTALAGTLLFIRFKTTTGDAMGMNMISKGVEHALSVMMGQGFDDMNIVSVSGNYCTDKKAAAINWTDGRGKSVVAEAIIPREVVKSVLKTDVDTMVELNISKNLIGSAMAGSIGGFNAHVANIVAAIFIATGQDPAQVVESANCITTMKNLGGSLQISVSMPSIEVGTLGGGTILEPQAAMLDMLGVRGPHPTTPGENSRRLARIVAATALAGELSLCSALAAGHLVKAHMQHNRSAPPTPAPTLSLTTSSGITAPLVGLQLDS